jgi:hypothetical protein
MKGRVHAGNCTFGTDAFCDERRRSGHTHIVHCVGERPDECLDDLG